jgi:hypothetical protein
MKLGTWVLLGYMVWVLPACTEANSEENNREVINSPDGQVQLSFVLEEGSPAYELSFLGKTVIQHSKLGFEFQQMKALASDLKLAGADSRTFKNEWETVWGERKKVQNHYNELEINLVEEGESGRSLNLYFRVFNDGLGFRYEIPEQPGIDSIRITKELTEFNFADNHSIWYQACDTTDTRWEDGYNTYERLYQNKKMNQVDMLMHTPATFELNGGQFLSIHEANLTDYASMVLANGGENKLAADLVPWPDGVKVKTKAPMVSPWRTIQVGAELADLVESDMILNLNEPNQLDDVSWIQPMKYVGIWWEMHLNKSTWEQGPNHGATTENTMKYIDFAAANGFGGVLVEGWNPGWEVWTTKPDFKFAESYPDYDLPYLASYAQSKGVNIISHHETSGDIITYEAQMDEAFDLLQENKIHAVKTGYVGPIRPEGQNHHGQWMINHYRKVVEMGAEHQVSIVAHEPIKPTGIRRTYPNMLAREAMRGMEYNAWSTGNTPEHTTVLPFTMMLAGPLDYTPGIFQTDLDAYRKGNSTHSTLANQLALYVTIYSPVQMAADLPEHYRNNPAFQFIRDIPTDWEDSKLLAGKIGDYIVMARKSRSTGDWFVGAITDENAREIDVTLDFLPEGESFTAQIYADEEDAHYVSNPMAVQLDSIEVINGQTLKMKLAAGGGQAIRIKPTANDTQQTAGF